MFQHDHESILKMVAKVRHCNARLGFDVARFFRLGWSFDVHTSVTFWNGLLVDGGRESPTPLALLGGGNYYSFDRTHSQLGHRG